MVIYPPFISHRPSLLSLFTSVLGLACQGLLSHDATFLTGRPGLDVYKTRFSTDSRPLITIDNPISTYPKQTAYPFRFLLRLYTMDKPKAPTKPDRKARRTPAPQRRIVVTRPDGTEIERTLSPIPRERGGIRKRYAR